MKTTEIYRLDCFLEDFAKEHKPNVVNEFKNQAALPFEHFMDGLPITPKKLSEYRQHLADKDLANSTKNKILQYLSVYLHWLRKDGRHTCSRDDIKDHLTRFKMTKTRPECLTTEQIAKLVETVVKDDQDVYASPSAMNGKPRPLAPTVLMGLLTGARRAEIEDIMPADVDHVGLQILGTKTATQRIIPFKYSKTLETLIKAAQRSTPFGLKPFSYSKRRWYSLVKKLRPHYQANIMFKTLRATYASYAMSSGELSLPLLSMLLGHSIATAQRYYWVAKFDVQGETIEEWYGCPEVFDWALSEMVCW